ncbi:MAG: ATP-binding protein [Sulfurimonadaceae bacterium]|nr:ATP-binding protein [Sulfurimonadaceae bacterium]
MQLVAVALVISTLSVTVLGLFDYSSQQKGVYRVIERIESGLAPAVAVSLWSLDSKLLQIELDGITREKTITYAEVIEDGQVVAQSGVLPEAGSRIIERRIPLNYMQKADPVSVGELRLVVDLWPLSVSAFKRMSLILLAVLFLVGVLGVAFFKIFERTVASHLMDISNYLSGLTVTKLDEPLIVSDERDLGRELETVVNAINDMRQQILASHLELEEANEKLKELDQMKSMFIASMSHELRTPLNSIIGFSDTILSGMTGELEEKQKDFLGRIRNAGKHLLSMIIDVIDISKIEAGQIEIAPEQFELHALLEEAAEMVEVSRKKKGLSLKIEQGDDIELYSDRHRVKQAVVNFLSNAVKFSEQGTITLRANVEEEHIVISVTDTGIGFGDDDRKRLFRPFERLDSHLKVEAGGAGLGLYVTKKVVEELLDGEVFVSSKVVRGVSSGLKSRKLWLKNLLMMRCAILNHPSSK